MVYLLIVYLLSLFSFLAIPYVVFHYILVADEYLISTSVFYPLLWIGCLIFLVAYFFISLQNFYYCYYQSSKPNKWNPFNLIKSLHAIMIATIYNSLYVMIFGLIGYIAGTITLDNVPVIRELFLSVVHVPSFVYFLKGIPLAIGSIVGNLLTSWCIDVQC